MNELVPIDRSKWNKPTYDGHYDAAATCYEGISCRCRKCERSFVFSAAEQQKRFELEGKYPGWLPSLCQSCEPEWAALLQKELEFAQRWKQRVVPEGQRVQFLNEWLSVLLEAESYRQKGFTQNVGMVRKMLRGEA